MDKQLKRKKLSEQFSCIYIGMITVYYMLSISKVTEQYYLNPDIIVYAAIPILILAVFTKKAELSTIALFFILICIGLLSAVITHKSTLLLTSTEIACCFDTDIKKIAKTMLSIEIIALVFNICMVITGVVINETVQYHRIVSFFGNGPVFRNSLGFSHYNNLGLVFFEISTLYLIVLEKYKTGVSIGNVLIFVLNIIIYFVSGDRTAFVSFILLVILISVIKIDNIGKYYKNIANFCIGVFPIICSWGIVFLYERIPNLYNLINNLFQTRPFYIYEYISRYGIKMLGNNISGPIFGLWGDPSQAANTTLDSGFANLVVVYGVILTIAYIIMMLLLIRKLNKFKQYYWIAYIIVICFYGVSENVVVFFTYNFCWMIIPIIFRKNEGELK